jgi:hypothetical protein
MKHIMIPAIAIVTLIACGNRSTPNGYETSRPAHVEYVASGDTTINFENDMEGTVPKGFTQTATGTKQTNNWKIVNDKGNKVVMQSAKNKGDYYNLLILDLTGYQNLIMSVKIKAVAGDEDQGGGMVWRYIDNNNYYIARYNPLENNFRFYKVVNGNRKQLKSVDCNIASGVWCTMMIEMDGNKISCLLNGNKLIETTDDTYKAAGRVGLWSKADAQTCFDDLIIQSLK